MGELDFFYSNDMKKQPRGLLVKYGKAYILDGSFCFIFPKQQNNGNNASSNTDDHQRTFVWCVICDLCG